MIRQNVAGQGVYLYAHDTAADAPKTGDSANIAGHVSLDGAAESPAASPVTEIDATNLPGVYWQALAQGETNGAALACGWISSTSDVAIDPLLVLTEPAPGTAGGAAGYAQVGAPVGASISADLAAVQTTADAIEGDTQDVQSRLPAALVSGRMDSDVGAMQAGVVTAAAVATDAIDADALAADAVSEIVTGVADAPVAGHAAGTLFGTINDLADAPVPYTPEEIAGAVLDASVEGHDAGTVGGTIRDIGEGVAGMVAAVWAYGTRTLTSFGTLVSDVVAALTAALVGESITTAGPVLAGGPLEIVRGDDYSVAGGNPLYQTNAALVGLDVDSVLWIFREGKDGDLIVEEGDWVPGTGTARCVSLPSVVSSQFSAGIRHVYVDVELTLPDGSKRTKFTPRMTVREGLN